MKLPENIHRFFFTFFKRPNLLGLWPLLIISTVICNVNAQFKWKQK